ncbi:HrpE/YscL family type III secretion apparatus protein [Thalassoglobus sp. JC818]|uniref:HrpE/YscL family type III secretion apparatus protein n=1 Tax=Thalassoglobus sp. JC818 TaxID=3232136 RepID=UPI0034574060
MFRIVHESHHLPTNRKLVKREDVIAALTADQIVAQAEADAAQIRLDAQLEYENQQRQGYEDGLELAKIERTTLMTEAVQQTTAYYAQVEQRMIAVVQRSLHNILGEIDDHQLIYQSVREGLNWARNQSRITLRIHPQHINGLRRRVDELKSLYPSVEIIDLEPDSHMSAHQCVVETEIGSIDASVDAQCEAVIRSLTQSIQDRHSKTFSNGLKNAELSEPASAILDEQRKES